MMITFVADFETGLSDDREEAWVYMAGLKEVGGDRVEIFYNIWDFINYLENTVRVHKDSIRVYFHNLSFDGKFILAALNPADYNNKVVGIKANGGLSAFNYKVGRRQVQFRDTYVLTRCSIKKLGDLFGIPKLDQEYRSYPENSSNIIPDVEKTYLKRDVEILERTVLQIQQNNIDGSSSSSYGIKEIKRSMAGQARSSELLERLTQADQSETLKIGELIYKSRFGDLSFANNEYIRLAYRSGFNILNPAFENKIIDDSMDLDYLDDRLVKYFMDHKVSEDDLENAVEVQLDINSLYLKALRDYRMPYGGVVKQLFDEKAFDYIYNRDEKDILNMAAFVDVSINGKVLNNINPVADVLKEKDEQGLWNVVLTYPEFVIISNSFGVHKRLTYPDNMGWCQDFENQFEIHDLIINSVTLFYSAYGMFDAFVDKWYAIKHGPKNFMQLISKQVLTNTVGCMGRKSSISFFDIKSSIDRKDDASEKGFVTWYVTDKKEVKSTMLDATASYTPVPAYVTSIGRCITAWTALKCGQRFIYSDTDQVHVLLEGDFGFLFDGSGPAFLSETDLGGFKIERMVRRAKFLKRKTYIEEDVRGIEYAVTAGIPDAAEKFSIDGTDGRVKFEIGSKYKQLMPHDVTGGVGLWDEEKTL